MSGEFEIPRFFRVLIIDDLVAGSPEYEEFFTNTLTALVLEKADGAITMGQVDVVFEYDPAKGFRRWQNEPFDFTLIDADFSTRRGLADDTDDLTQYVLNSREQGLQIFKLIEAQMNEYGLFAYRKKMCQFFVWTALSDTDKKGTPGLKTLIDKDRFDIDRKYVIKKDEKSLGTLKSKIDACVKNILNNKFFTPSQKIERLLSALRKDNDVLLRNLYGGCLIFDAEQKYTFLPTFGDYPKDGAVTHIRLCCAHIPESLLLADEQQSETRFLPLHRKIIQGKTIDSVEYLLKGERRDTITTYCDLLRERQKKLQRLPWFPASKNNRSGSETEKPSFIAAATPLTGTTVIGGNNAVSSLCDKIAALLKGPFDKVILKTTYLDSLDQWGNAWWPSVHIQSHMRSRCLYPDSGTPTLWNSGKTAMETLPPRQLNDLLKCLVARGNDTGRVVVSLGSKFPKGKGMARVFHDNIHESLRIIWQHLFDDVFDNVAYDSFPTIEINVRHFLREIVHYHLGGDEYLTPKVLNEKSSPDPVSYWKEFKLWLAVIHKVAVEHRKKLILKLPHRSDTLAYVECVVSLREHHLISCPDDFADYGVGGITVVNALKTPVPRQNKQDTAIRHTPPWYADPDSWGDAQGKLYQMSGRLVGAYRNQILAGLMSGVKALRDLGLEIWISGGLTSQKEVQHCLELEIIGSGKKGVINGIQIGTWALIDTDLSKDAKGNWCDRKKPKGPAYNKNQQLPKNEEGGKKKIREDFLPRFSFLNIHKCEACGRCSQTFYCDAFVDRVNTKLPPLMDSRYCSGCGLCAQVCSSGALQLYPPEEFLVLLSSSRERKEILDMLRIPYLQYHPKKDLDNFADWIRAHIDKLTENDQQSQITRQTLELLWSQRVQKDNFMLHQDEPKLYPENRETRKDICIETATKLLEEAKKNTNEHAKNAIQHAALWSQLIWSDPGQVLWDSFLLSIQSVIATEDGKNMADSASIAELNGNNFFIKSWVVMLRKGEVLVNEEIQSQQYKLKIAEDEITRYDASDFGANRAAWLDVRGCGESLVQPSNASSMSENLKIELAGLPWEKIKETIGKLPEHKEALKRLCNAVS